MDSILYRVVAPHFVAGIEFNEDGSAARACQRSGAAPILAWVVMRRWNLARFEAYCKTKGWQIKPAMPNSGYLNDFDTDAMGNRKSLGEEDKP